MNVIAYNSITMRVVYLVDREFGGITPGWGIHRCAHLGGVR